MVLCAQLSDWRKFRIFQGRDRARYRTQPFSNFVDDVRDRRRRQEISGNVRLLLDPEQQSRLENWVEFQNYHLKHLERFQKKRDQLEEDLDDARKKAEVSERAAQDAEAFQIMLKTAERYLERHKVLLQWIEQERRTMGPGHLIPAEEDNDDRHTAPNPSLLLGKGDGPYVSVT